MMVSELQMRSQRQRVVCAILTMSAFTSSELSSVNNLDSDLLPSFDFDLKPHFSIAAGSLLLGILSSVGDLTTTSGM